MADEYPFERRGTCQHPQVTDQQLEENHASWERTWGDTDPITCPDCREYLYLSADTVYAGEPPGAGMETGDPAGSRIW
jgi:hypothetical protein